MYFVPPPTPTPRLYFHESLVDGREASVEAAIQQKLEQKVMM